MRSYGAVTAVAKEVLQKITAIRHALAKRLGKQRFDLWFGAEHTLSLKNGTVRIGLPNLLFQKWVMQQFREDIVAACAEVLGFSPVVEFLPGPTEEWTCQSNGGFSTQGDEKNGEGSPISESLSPQQPPVSPPSSPAKPLGHVASRKSLMAHEDPAPGDAEAASSDSSSEFLVEPKDSLTEPADPAGVDNPLGTQGLRESLRGNALVETCFEVRPETVHEETLFPELVRTQPPSSPRRRRKKDLESFSSLGGALTRSPAPSRENDRRKVLTFADFAVGPCNQLAFATAAEVARHPGQLSPLFLSGPTSVGKTHLLQAITEEARRWHPQLWVVYLSADDFVTAYVGALRNGGLPSWRSKFRHVDLLAVDDIQVLIGKRWVQRELLLTIDALLRDGKQVVLACDRPPEELSDFGEDLLARIKSGLSCTLDWPDCQTRRMVVDRLCQRLSFPMAEEVRDFVAFHIAGHARDLLGAIRRLQAAAITCGSLPDRATAEKVLEDLVRVRHRPVRLKDICEAVCDVFGIEAEKLVGPSRSQPVVQPRLVAMWLARKLTRSGLSEISRFFGRKSHSAVLAAHRTVERWLAEDRTLRVGDRHLSVNDVIRHVERRLQLS